MKTWIRTAVCAAALVAVAGVAGAQQVTKPVVAGVTNFAKLDTTIACAGATTPAGVAEVKKMGYKSIINLRQASEPGADIEGETAAAKTAGIRFFNFPVNGASPDPAMVDQFLTTIGDAANQPAFVHCASGQRAAAFWLIKRLVVDGWDGEKAGAEAAALGLTSPALKTFATDYAASHRK